MNASTNTPIDTLFDALRSSHRRHILLEILDHNPRDEDEFASNLDDPDDTTDGEVEQLKAELHHRHLPMLADAGYIEWNPDTETIRRGPNFDEVAPLLTLMLNHPDELPDGWP
ncbi:MULTISPECIES: transcriptional regulator [unclassified Haladaptatus]|uniref:DUF7344 domain-containing protein n=1 Tax=unclassified Haladaptatus TaxID=2622732 RepID=UPI00209C4225|nr:MULTISPECIES: transcriptional regulator [unclassified Haladaptatus]MCO8245584.1 transcriptional regulator [Haladaptatus sp. AB643]MCO8255412.1 transcriptional regulator [Haladaptatus sp. AB618]